MIEYLIPLMAAVLGFGVAWFIWGRADVIAPPVKPEIGAPKKSKRTIWRPLGKGAKAAPFRVVTLDGKVHYDGASGGDARRCIELLRTQDVEWRAYRNGDVCDWGPRPEPMISVLFSEAGETKQVYRGLDVGLAKHAMREGRDLIENDASAVTGVRVYKGQTLRGSWGSWSQPLSLSGG